MKLIAMISDAAEDDTYQESYRIGLSTSNDYVASLKNWLIFTLQTKFPLPFMFPSSWWLLGSAEEIYNRL